MNGSRGRTFRPCEYPIRRRAEFIAFSERVEGDLIEGNTSASPSVIAPDARKMARPAAKAGRRAAAASSSARRGMRHVAFGEMISARRMIADFAGTNHRQGED